VKKKILGFIIVLMVNIIVVAMAPALAKNFNLPEGVERIYRSGGTAVVDTPADFPFSSLEIMAFNLEAGTHGPGESFVIQMPWMGGWMPIAHFTTSPDSVAFLSALWSGLTASANTMFVSDSELNVVRHGNRITASLTVPKVITMRVGEVTIPAFTMELNKVGGSIHTENTIFGTILKKR
jgi:hypothetical protein